MANQTISVLRLDVPGNSLAAWLVAHHPDLFLAVFKQAQAAKLARTAQLKGLRGLADNGVTTTFDTAPSDSLDTVTLTTNTSPESLPPSLLTDATSSGSSWLSDIGSGLTSVGSTIGSVLSSAGSGVLSAIGGVGSYLTSSSGLSNLTGLAKTYFAAQGATATAQTQQAVLQAQVARAASGQGAAPITYQRDAYGNVLPVYATQTAQGTVYQPLSHQGIASLTPSSFSIFLSQYGLWLGLGALGLVALVALRR